MKQRHKPVDDVAVQILRKLVQQMDRVHESAEYKTVWNYYAAHFSQAYPGPTYTAELREAQKFLEAIDG